MHLLRFFVTVPSLAELGRAEARSRARVPTQGPWRHSQPYTHASAPLSAIKHDLDPVLHRFPISLLHPKLLFKSHSAPHPTQTPAASS